VASSRTLLSDHVNGNMKTLGSVGKSMDTFIRSQFRHLGTEWHQNSVKYSEWSTTPTMTDQMCRILQSNSPSTSKQKNSFPEGKEISYLCHVNKTLLARTPLYKARRSKTEIRSR
jgi:hypothetical protein